MRKIIFLFFLDILGSMLLLKAQVADTALAAARYSFVHISDTTQPNNPLKLNMILFLGKTLSHYTNYAKVEEASKAKAGEAKGFNTTLPMKIVVNGQPVDPKTIDMSTVVSINVNKETNSIMIETNPAMAFRDSYFKDQVSSTLSYIDYVGKLFAVEEKIPVINWNIKSETKEVMGLPCQKAVADFRGRTYEAWFCSQLPYNNGPWKLGGLPGLILEAYDNKKEVIFTLTSFENVDTAKIVIALPAGLTKTTPKEFNRYRDAIQNNPSAMAGNAVNSGPTKKAGPGGGKSRQMNNPIEKEIVK